jgi:hypothetical protein
MTRESHVRFYEGLGVKLRRATHPLRVLTDTKTCGTIIRTESGTVCKGIHIGVVKNSLAGVLVSCQNLAIADNRRTASMDIDRLPTRLKCGEAVRIRQFQKSGESLKAERADSMKFVTV